MEPWWDDFWARKECFTAGRHTCTETWRVSKGLHSCCSGCVLGDMARLYKILWLVSSQRPVSKHAASVCLQACLSLRPRSARITQSKAAPFNRVRTKYWSCTALGFFLWTRRFCPLKSQGFKLLKWSFFNGSCHFYIKHNLDVKKNVLFWHFRGINWFLW